jgi:formyltetrahydrofolate deformylase
MPEEKKPRFFVLTLSCPDKIGIVYAVAKYLFEHRGNIVDSGQFDDMITGRFFMRVAFEALDDGYSHADLCAAFTPVAREFGMEWRLFDQSVRLKIVLMSSKFDHCLTDLLYRQSIGELEVDIPAVISNHRDSYRLAAEQDIPFHHLPVTKETKKDQEKKLLALLDELKPDLIVLARYMQVLSDDLCSALPCPAINIHHSFLPSFKGAMPYHQAHNRGVKLIGATAHFVTPDLDEGPIIEQGVERVTHAMPPEKLAALGRDVEKMVLARAVRLQIEHRVLLNDGKTVVFS